MATIVEVLNASLSPDANTRTAAEARLTELMQSGETGIGLATLLVSPELDLSLRQISTLLQRKYILEHWSPYFPPFRGHAPSVEIKAKIRELVFTGLGDPARKVRTASSFALSTILQSDWPDECPDFLDSLISLLSTGSSDAIDGAMRVFAEFIKGDLSEDQILPIMRQLLPVLLSILGQPERHAPLTRARVLSVFNQCIQMLFMVKDEHPDAVKEAVTDILPIWVNALRVLLEIPPTNDIETNEWDGLVLRFQVFKVLDQIQLGFPRAMTAHSHALLTLALTHLHNYLPVFQQFYVDSSGDNTPCGTSEDPADQTLLTKLGCSIFQFIQTSGRAASNKPWFLSPEILPKLLGAVIGWTQMTEEDVETWTSDANAFVSDENDDEAWTLRAACFDMCAALINKLGSDLVRTLQAVSHQVVHESTLAKNSGQADWWKLLESTLATIGSLSEDLEEILDEEDLPNGQKSFDLEFWLTTVVPNILSLGDLPFLQGRGFVFASRYASVLPSQLFNQYLNAAVEVLEARNAGIPVKLSAVRAIRNFSMQTSSASALVPLATRMAQDLAPFLLVTSEDTLALVADSLLAVIEVDKSQWLTPALAAPMVEALMQVWVKNVRDPILLSTLTDIFVALAKCPTPGVYQAVVTQTLPPLARAIGEAKPDEVWVTSSAIDLATSLMRGAKKGELGDGFFAMLGPALFDTLMRTEDREVIQNGVECLTFVIRKGCDQLVSFVSPTTGERGVTLLLRITAKLLAPPAENSDGAGVAASEAGGLFVGDMMVHLLRNAGGSEEMRNVMPELMRALVGRLETAKTLSFIQSLISPLLYLLHTQRDAVLSVLESMPIGSSNGLTVLIQAWCENAETFQGFWASRISTLAMCEMFLSDRPSLKTIQVKGDMILRPETKDVIVTRSRAKQTPHQFTMIPFHVRALKLLLNDLQSSGHEALALAQGESQVRKDRAKEVDVDVDLDKDDDAEAEDWDDEEDLYHKMKDEELGFLSDLIDEADGDQGGRQGDDEDLQEDPISQIDIRTHLLHFFRHAAQANVNDFSRVADGLSVDEIAVLRKAVNS